jgi:hypothetical protein
MNCGFLLILCIRLTACGIFNVYVLSINVIISLTTADLQEHADIEKEEKTLTYSTRMATSACDGLPRGGAARYCAVCSRSAAVYSDVATAQYLVVSRQAFE